MLILLNALTAAIAIASLYWASRAESDKRLLNLRISHLENQSSKLTADLDVAQTRYDNLVASIRAQSKAPVDTVRKVRQARTFAEFRDAAEKGTLPKGVKEKNVNPNV